MPARIEVVEGPDRGWRFTLLADEARIGRGAGNQVKLTDPAWPGGELRVTHRQGGYLVTNGLPQPVYLDGKPVAPGRVKNLHHGAILQPTASTLLRLEIVEAPPGADGPVLAEPPPPPSGGGGARRLLQVGLVLALALFAARLFSGRPRVDPQAAAPHLEAVRAVEEDPKAAAFRPQLRAGREAVRDGHYLELKGDLPGAQSRYRRARDLIAPVRLALSRADPEAGREAVPESAARLVGVESFVTARLTATATPRP